MKQKEVEFLAKTIIILAMILWFGTCALMPTPLSDRYTKARAQVMAQYFIEQRLTSPASAEYQPFWDSMQKINDTTFTVYGYVDSQNGYGAMMRSSYSCIMTVYPYKEIWKCENLIIK